MSIPGKCDGETYFHAACYNNKEKRRTRKKRRKGSPRVADYWARVSVFRAFPAFRAFRAFRAFQ